MPNVFETTDAAAGTSTIYTLTTGQTAQGILSASNDHDWYRVDLTAGQTYTFAMTGTGVSNVQDPYLRLYAPGGSTLVAQDDDGLPGANSIFTYTATSSGAYFIDAASFNNSGTGQYGISFTAGSRASFDLQMGAGVIDTDLSWSGANVTYGFRQTSNGEQATFFQTTAAQVAAIQSIVQMYSEVSGLTFTQVNPGGYTDSATILIGDYNANDGAGAYAYYPGSTSSTADAGDIWINTSANAVSTTSLPVGSYSYFALAHELGHAVGLSHPGEYNAAPGVSITYAANAQFGQDTHQYTIMSYFDESNTTGSYNSYPDTLMLLDVYALQQIYGANSTTRSGDTIYGFNGNAGGVYNFATNTNPAMCIWDGSGNDTLNVSGYSQSQVINLNPGTFSNIGGLTGNISIALGCTIENAVGGSGSDRIYLYDGGAFNNSINGGGGTDTVYVTYAYGVGYTVSGTASNLVMTGAAAGTDTFQSVEYVIFSNGAQVSTADLAATVTLTNYITISDVTISEGNSGTKVATFTVTRTGDSSAFAVNYATANGTASAGSDYLAANGTLNFETGVNSQTISVTINGDTTVESDETYFVNLSGATNGATIADSQGQGTIVDNDGPGGDDYADSFADSTAPFGLVSIGGSATGSLEVAGDRDWFEVSLVAGQLYTISEQGLPTLHGTLLDSYLRLHDASGALLAQNDDVNYNAGIYDSQLSYWATATGTYYIEAGAYADFYAGTYAVSVTLADDYAGNASTAGLLAAGGPASGNLESLKDRDWFRVQVAAGHTYTIDLQGLDTAAGTLSDPYLYLYSSSSKQVLADDDSGTGANSQLSFLATSSGTYYVAAAAYRDSLTGTYQISMSESAGVTINGTKLADTIDATHGIGGIFPTDSDDTINGLAGNDTIDGGNGNDTLTGGAGTDVLTGGAGNDTFNISGTGDAFDSFSGGADTDTMKAIGSGPVTLGGFDPVAMQIEVWVGNNNGVMGTTGNNTFDLTGLTLITGLTFVDGGAGNDTLIGSDLVNNDLRGNAGNDTLTGGSGNDTLTGGAGTDVLTGGAGNDTFNIAGTGDAFDSFSGGADTDTIKMTAAVTLNGFDATADSIEAWLNTSAKLVGVTGAPGVGTAANQTFDLSGLTSITGLTFFDGGTGDDLMIGSSFADDLRGGAGSDTLRGGAGDDKLSGGKDKVVDTFVFGNGDGHDTIMDLTFDKKNALLDDHIDLTGLGLPNDYMASVHAHMTQVGTNVVIDFYGDGTDTLTIMKTTIAILDAHASDFHLV